MATRQSAGILLYRRQPELQVLLGRLGGPFWARRREQNWSIPKGEPELHEAPLDTARREFTEELGLPVPEIELTDLGEVRQKGGKTVRAYAGEVAELDLSAVVLGTFELEWPPRSGTRQSFPELAELAWCDQAAARVRLVSAQTEFLDRLLALLGETPAGADTSVAD